MSDNNRVHETFYICPHCYNHVFHDHSTNKYHCKKCKKEWDVDEAALLDAIPR